MASGGGEAADVMPLPGEASKAGALSPLPRGTPATSLALSRPTPQQPAPCTATTATTFAPTPRSSLSGSGGGCGGSIVAANNGSGLAPASAECASRELFTDFNRRDAELHNPSPSSTCVARIKTGARKNSVCGRPVCATSSHFCGFHVPRDTKKRARETRDLIDGVDIASLPSPTIGMLAKRCVHMVPGHAGAPDVQCQNTIRGPSDLCHRHRGQSPAKRPRKYRYVDSQLRELAVDLVADQNLSCGQAAKQLHLPRQTVNEIVQHFYKTGNTQRSTQRDAPPNKKVTEDIVAFVKSIVWAPKLEHRRADVTLRQLCDSVATQFGVRMCPATMSGILKNPGLQITMKKLRAIKKVDNSNV